MKKTIHTKVTYLNYLISIFNTFMLPLIFSKDVALIVNDATLRQDCTPFKEHCNIYDIKNIRCFPIKPVRLKIKS